MKVMQTEILISSCKGCKHLKYTESNYYCEEMKLGKYTYREITDTGNIHELCPLDDVVGFTT